MPAGISARESAFWRLEPYRAPTLFLHPRRRALVCLGVGRGHLEWGRSRRLGIIRRSHALCGGHRGGRLAVVPAALGARGQLSDCLCAGHSAAFHLQHPLAGTTACIELALPAGGGAGGGVLLARARLLEKAVLDRGIVLRAVDQYPRQLLLRSPGRGNLRPLPLRPPADLGAGSRRGMAARRLVRDGRSGGSFGQPGESVRMGSSPPRLPLPHRFQPAAPRG